jgi:hypothetical protein
MLLLYIRVRKKVWCFVCVMLSLIAYNVPGCVRGRLLRYLSVSHSVYGMTGDRPPPRILVIS